jgi:hypothetical protein
MNPYDPFGFQSNQKSAGPIKTNAQRVEQAASADNHAEGAHVVTAAPVLEPLEPTGSVTAVPVGPKAGPSSGVTSYPIDQVK